jgi:cysteine desulfurase / selenocysteine lyase
VPDWDPLQLAGMVSRMANEMFAAPSPSIVAGDQHASPASTPQQPALSSAPPAGAMSSPTGLSEPASPFAAPLNFGALAGIRVPAAADASLFDALRVPLLDIEPVAPSTTMTDAPVAPSAPTLPSEADADAYPRLYELDTTPELGLGPSGGSGFDAYAIRREFPILEERPHGKRLVWLDNAATTQKPLVVIERLSTFYRRENSNVHRAAHTLAARATDAYEGARETVRRFLNAPSSREIVFVRGATEAINLVAQSWGRRNVQAGDEIVITWLEHHANIIPWQMLCSEKGARLRVAPVDDRGQVILEEYEKLLGEKTRLVAVPQVSNALGTVTPTREMVQMAHRHGALVLVDGAQSVSHMRVDVQQLDCDFFVFSGHKIFAPTGIGVLWGRQQLLDTMPPWQGGGNMIEEVTFEKSTYQPAPARFEAGTGSIADAVGLGAALDWLTRVGLENVERHEHELLVYATQELQTVPGLRIIGTAPEKAGVISFVIAGRDSAEVAHDLDREGIAVRGGHHCAQPIVRRFGLESTVRASLAPYNVCEDIDALVAALQRLQASASERK